ncbi:APC family permease [Streptomyces sp. NBC_01207]|nr:APC family permease [Streptomyces sp. NBC_01207]
MVYAVLGIAVICALGHFDVQLSGRVLGVFLIAEVFILLLMGAAVLRGGGPDGLMPHTLDPADSLTAVGGGSAAIGMFFAFWSWVGFETTAVHGEEYRNPTRIIPRATLIVVIAFGALYTFVSWAAVAGNGAAVAVAISGGTTGNPFDLFLGITRSYVGVWAEDVYLVLTVTGSFACALAFHNSASRYLYAIGREGLQRALTPLGTTHDRHRSPYVSSLLQSAVTLLITLYFYLFQAPTEMAPDVPYYYEFGLLAIMGTMGILIVQTITSIAVVWYFHVRGNHPETRFWWRTLLAPLAGAVGMGWVVYLLFSNLEFAAGAVADSPVYTLTPYLVTGTGVLGVVVALVLRTVSPPAYQRIGSTVLAESHERG